MYLKRYIIAVSENEKPKLSVKFYKSPSGHEPVREWLSDPRQVKPQDRKTIGTDIKTVQYGWPMGMPIVRKLESDLWEVRSNVSVGISRVLFTIQVLLHGFIKKQQKTPPDDLDVARKRKAQLRGEK